MIESTLTVGGFDHAKAAQLKQCPESGTSFFIIINQKDVGHEQLCDAARPSPTRALVRYHRRLRNCARALKTTSRGDPPRAKLTQRAGTATGVLYDL